MALNCLGVGCSDGTLHVVDSDSFRRAFELKHDLSISNVALPLSAEKRETRTPSKDFLNKVGSLCIIRECKPNTLPTAGAPAARVLGYSNWLCIDDIRANYV